MKLYEAVKLYKREERASVNSYQWYRRCAKDYDYVHISLKRVPLFKIKGLWYVDERTFKNAIISYRKNIEEIMQNTKDHEIRIIHAQKGSTHRLNGMVTTYMEICGLSGPIMRN